MDAEEEEEEEEEALEVAKHKQIGIRGERGWIPGLTCGRWIDTQNPLLEQGRVLVVNAVVTVSRVPRQLVNALLKHWPPGYSQQKKSIAHTFVGRLLGLSPSLVQEVMKQATQNAMCWSPCPRRSSMQTDVEAPISVEYEACAAGLPAAAGRSGSSAVVDGRTGLSAAANGRAGLSAAATEDALRNLVRLAIATAAEGRSWQAYIRDVARCNLAGGSVGSRYASRHFAVEVAAMASMVLQQLDSHDFNAVLPGLGIPSDFPLLADPVSMGDTIMSRHDVLLIVALALTSARTGRVYNPMHSGRAVPVGSHSGAAMATLLLEALAQHPACWSIHVLRARCACIGGDGGLVLGGPDHRHQSAAVAERLWRWLHEEATAPMCTTWDPFHRVDIAVWWAVRRHDRIIQIFDLAKEVDFLFGQSEGAVIFRSIATRLDQDPHAIRAPGGTRKVVYLTGIPCSLVENFKLGMTGLWARWAWKQAGHSSQSIRHILDVARRLASVRLVVVMLLLQDVLGGIIRPFAKSVQAHLEPASFLRAQRLVLGKIETARRTIRRIRVLMRVLSLCRQHADPGALANFIEAHACGSMGSVFPTFFRHVGGIVGPQCTFQGCKMDIPDQHNRSQQMFLGAHCQCSFKEQHLAGVWASWRGRGPAPPPEIPNPRHPGRVVRVPVWVAPRSEYRSCSQDCVDMEPRCTFRRLGLHAPPGQNSAGMFRRRIVEEKVHETCSHVNSFTRGGGTCPCRWTSRCQLSHRIFLADCECNAGLAETDAFLHTLSTELSQVLSSVGVNQTMATVLESSAQCWDWSRLVFERPTAEDVRAFRRIAALLRHDVSPQESPHPPP